MDVVRNYLSRPRPKTSPSRGIELPQVQTILALSARARIAHGYYRSSEYSPELTIEQNVFLFILATAYRDRTAG